jgi:hypothetical protein
MNLRQALYNKQLRFQQTMQLRDCEDCLRRVLRVWSPHLGLLGGEWDGDQVPSGEAKEGDGKHGDIAFFSVLSVRFSLIGCFAAS